jgi:hypothetical protein
MCVCPIASVLGRAAAAVFTLRAVVTVCGRIRIPTTRIKEDFAALLLLASFSDFVTVHGVSLL